ncbi:MAG TPA: MarR family winged helix-turn-helix transcriptional regulator [Sphingobium sp.]
MSEVRRVGVDQGGDLSGWKIDQLDFPTFRIGLLAKIMDRLTIRQLGRQTNLSYAQWRVLARLGMMDGGGTVRDIAALAWVDRAEVSRAVGALEALGLVSREDNPVDRRAPILWLTTEGDRVYRDVLRQRKAFHESLLANLSAKERTTLDDLLARIGERLGEIGES